MRAWVVLSVALACVYGCGGSDGPSAPPASDGGEAGAHDSPASGGAGGESGQSDNAAAGSATAGGAPALAGTGGAAGAAAGAETSGGGAEQAGADPGPPEIDVGIALDTTRFTDYGKLRIVFAQAVDAATLTIALVPQLPAKLFVSSVSQVDATTVDATLAWYHLPRDYQIRVTGNLPDATRFKATADISGLNNGARVGFITKETGPGALATWAGVPQSATPLEAADSVCQKEAEAAGLRGTFQAFLSVNDNLDAGCRAFGLDGKLANNCGQAEMPVDHTPILRVDGWPIVAGATDIAADRWATAIPLQADGRVATPFYTWTGSIFGARSYTNNDCSGWTASTGNGMASTQVGERLVRYEAGRSCDVLGDLLCLQTGATFFGPSKLHEVSGKRAFVTKGHLYGTMSFGGKFAVAAGDALCQSEAASAAFENADKFRAYLGTADTDALCYILGRTGKLADHCGLAALPDTDPWRRPDNYPIGTAAQLAAGKLDSALALAADLTILGEERPRTGTELSGATSWNCGDWSSGGFYSLSGDPRFITGKWTSEWTTDCDGEQTSLYCFEN